MVVFPAASRPSMTTFTGEQKKWWSGVSAASSANRLDSNGVSGRRRKNKGSWGVRAWLSGGKAAPMPPPDQSSSRSLRCVCRFSPHPDRSLPFFLLKAPEIPSLSSRVCVCVCVSYPHVLVSEDLVEKLSQRPPHLVVTLFACLKLRHTLCYGSPPDALVRFRVGALPQPRTLAHPVSPFFAAMDSIPSLSSIYGFAFRQGKMASGISPSSGKARKGERTEG